jgi:thioredoxin reductase/NAD-dependent dihydropyrimidine dehydrogenase PreA subunit
VGLVRKDPQYAEGVEIRPELDRHFQSNIKGLYIVGAANGSPLLKTCINEGVEVVRAVSRLTKPSGADDPVDLLIIGAGPAGLAAALEAEKRGYSYRVLEKIRPLDTILNFPEGKHVYAEPASLVTEGELWLEDSVKEELLEKWGLAAGRVRVELGTNVADIKRSGDVFEVKTREGQSYRGRKVILAMGRMGNPRRLNVPGEDLGCVYSKLLNPGKYSGKDLLVIGGGNSAAEAVLALMPNNRVTMIHRGDEFPRLSATNRGLLQTAEQEKKIRILRKSGVKEFRMGEADLQVGDKAETAKVDASFVLIGGDPPTAFLKRLGVRFEGSWLGPRLIHLTWVFALVYCIYGIKAGLWPFKSIYAGLMAARVDPGLLYGLLYSFLMTFFGLKAMRRYREDKYQQKRYGTLIAAQWIVYFALPWGLWYLLEYGEYWRTWGVSLTYPLGYYGLWDPAEKLFSGTVLPWALATLAGFLIFMPIFSIFHGKRFCAWFCPCGGLAETVGDAWRHKAPRGKPARLVEVSSTVILIATVVISIFLISGYRDFLSPAGVKSGYKFLVDLGLASIVAITLYPFSGGRIWCRFFCPLAKWMEWWGRWGGGKLAIVPNEECISCGECTRYCQMGIDVRAFAQRQQPLSNKTTCCIFCGICVTVCPVDVLKVERR